MKLKHEFESILPMLMAVDDFRMMYNYVIVEFDPKQCEQTPSGIYTPLKSVDHDVAVDFVPRIGTVVKLPKTLYYDRKNYATSMRWKTTIELQPGDTVWMNHSTAYDYQFTHKDKLYKCIHYEDIVCAKRGQEVIMCNGYILCRPYYITKKALLFEKKEYEVNQAIIEHMGSINTEYQNFKRKDSESLHVGDMVLFDKKDVGKVRYLESDYFLKFDGKPHIVVQRYMIAAVLN